MKTLAYEAAGWGYSAYDQRWQRVARAGLRSLALDTRLHGWRYLSLNALVLTPSEAAQLAELTPLFGRLLTRATHRLLEDPAWWADLSWPRPAIELARQEPAWPGLPVTPYGRFDWLMSASGRWQLAEFNADTPSGGRETCGLEPPVRTLYAHHGLRRASGRLAPRLVRALRRRIAAYQRSTGQAVHSVGVVSSHAWTEDLAQAWWLAGLLAADGVRTVVGDATDLATAGHSVLLRGQPIQALYRFYPVERLYRHGVFGPLLEASVEGRLLLLNGLRTFLAQSKAALAYLWDRRGEHWVSASERQLVEAHLPAVLRAREPAAARILADSVVKHVNGREGDDVALGATLSADAWEARLLEGGYVVQRRVEQQPLEDVEVDEARRTVDVAAPRYACVGTYYVDGRFGGCYTRLGGLITQTRATFLPTLVAAAPP